MQEQERISMLDYLTTALASAKQRSFIHRLIYFTVETRRDDALVSATIEENVKDASYGQWSPPLAGMAIATPQYFINIMEGTENALMKHLSVVSRILKDVKILLFLPHVKERHFINWTKINGELGNSSDAMLDTSQHGDDFLLAKKCIQKLTSLFDLPRRIRETELSESPQITPELQRDLQELAAIESLADSPLVRPPEKESSCVGHYTTQHYLVWPAPSQFIPRFITE